MPEEQRYTFEEWQEINDKLNRQLGPEFLSQRPGPSGRSLTYIEGKTAITLANDIFGFNGWSTQIKDVTVDFVDVDENKRVSLGVAVTVRITLKDGSFHEDQGYGSEVNARNKAVAFEKARKQGVTDATKRALRFFGNSLGNCLYDTPYLGGIGKMAKPTIKFTPNNLYRHSQFETPKVAVTSPPPQQQITATATPARNNQLGPSKPAKTESKKVYHPPPLNAAQQEEMEKKIEASRQSLMEPIIPEDSFSYEGDDEFLVQILAADDGIDFHVADDIDNEMLAGIITPPPLSVASSASQNQVKREPVSLSDENYDDQQSKKQRTV